MNKNIVQVLIGLFVVVAVLFVPLFAADTPSEQVIQVKQAPQFVLADQNEKTFSLADQKGKIVVIEWINYDCPFVKAHYQAGSLKKLTEQYAKDKVVFIAINSTHYGDSKANQAFIKQYELPFLVLSDKDGKVGRLYGAITTPHIFIVDAKGAIAYQGAFDNAPMAKKPEKEAYVNYTEKAINELLAGKDVTIKQVKPYGCSVKYAAPSDGSK